MKFIIVFILMFIVSFAYGEATREDAIKATQEAPTQRIIELINDYETRLSQDFKSRPSVYDKTYSIWFERVKMNMDRYSILTSELDRRSH